MKTNPFAKVSTLATTELHIKKPDGRPMYFIDKDGKEDLNRPTTFVLRSSDTKEHKEMMRELFASLKKSKKEDFDRLMYTQEATLKSHIVEWYNFPDGDGGEVPFNKENLHFLVTEEGVGYIRNQVNQEVAATENFMKS